MLHLNSKWHHLSQGYKMKYFFTSLSLWLSILCLVYANTPSLADKLENQWQIYKNPQHSLYQVVSSGEKVDRTTWEKMVKPHDEWKFTDEDLMNLTKMQSERILVAKEVAYQNSVINFDAFRKLPAEEAKIIIHNFCQHMPKGGMLHVHPFGTFTRNTLTQLMILKNPILDWIEFLNFFNNPENTCMIYPEENNWMSTFINGTRFSDLSPIDQKKTIDLFFLPFGNHDFTRFDSVFVFLGIPVSTYQDYLFALENFAQKASAQGIFYIEFTTDILTDHALNFYKNLADTYLKNFGIILKINESLFRLDSDENMRKNTRTLLMLNDPILVGVDLLGNESNSPTLENGQIPYALVGNALTNGTHKIKRTIHAGELGDDRNPRDALIFGVERIGHGIKLENDPIALEYAASKKIGIEINLTSNIRLKAVNDIKQHPFVKYLRLGIPVSLSTDDEGIFETDMNTECEIAISQSDITYAELKQMAINSIETAFVGDQEKSELLSKLLQQINKFEQTLTSLILPKKKQEL